MAKNKTTLEELIKAGWVSSLETESKIILEMKIPGHTYRCLWDKEVEKVEMQIEYFDNDEMTVIFPKRITTCKKNFCKDTHEIQEQFKKEKEWQKSENASRAAK